MTSSEVPLIFDFDALISAFLAEKIEPTAENIETAACRLGRNYYPALVWTLDLEGLLWGDDTVAQQVVPSAWSAAEFPMLQLEPAEWRELFDLAGYTVEGRPAPRPESALTLYRGALPAHRDGWSWTDDRALAQWFADRPHNAGKGRVWVASVTPDRLLARISEQRDGESEYVVDTDGLTIIEG